MEGQHIIRAQAYIFRGHAALIPRARIRKTCAMDHMLGGGTFVSYIILHYIKLFYVLTLGLELACMIE